MDNVLEKIKELDLNLHLDHTHSSENCKILHFKNGIIFAINLAFKKHSIFVCHDKLQNSTHIELSDLNKLSEFLTFDEVVKGNIKYV